MNLTAGTSSGQRTVSLTERQAAALGFKTDTKPIKIGCGAEACAYAAEEPNTVVKVTKDETDALVCHLLKQSGTIPQWAVPIHAVHRLEKNAFVIVATKVQPLPILWAKPIDELYEFADEEDQEPEDWTTTYKGCLREIEWLEAEHHGSTPRDARMRQALTLVNDAVLALRAMGFHWCDYHSDNWGLLDGRPVLIDFGSLETIDGAPLEKRIKDIPVLPF